MPTKNFFKKTLLFVFSFLVLGSFFAAGKVYAANTDAIPKPGVVPCDTSGNPEFNSDRPYQASPCGGRPITYWCGNSVVVDVGSVSTPWNSGTCSDTSCPTDQTVNFGNIVIDLSNVELPILGNTEQTANSVNASGSLDDATRMNEYVSSYLNGTIDQAEYGATDTSKYVDFSGPIKKLLPSILQDAQRIDTIKQAGTNITYNTDASDTPQTQSTSVTEPQNHNQIVVCGESSLGIVGDITGLGTFKPIPCYTGNGSPAQGRVFRLINDKGGFTGAADQNQCSYVCRVPGSVECKRCMGQGLNSSTNADSWDGDLSFWNTFVNDIVGKIVSLVPTLPQDAVRESVLNHWNKRIPPLPWDNDPFTGKPMTNLEYQKYYNEWRGKTCVIVPILNQLVCFDNVLVPNRYADLFPYIPLANTTDKKGAQMVTGASPSAAQADVSLATPTGYVLKYSPVLYIPHSLEASSLSNLLVSTYLPKPKDSTSTPSPEAPLGGAITTKDVEYNSSCRIVPSRTNTGDSTTFSNPVSQIEIDDFSVHVSRISCTTSSTSKCLQYNLPGLKPDCLNLIEVPSHVCKSEVYATIPSVSKNPYADNIWQNTVAGEDSVFRRIYPKSGPNSPVSCIADTPAVSPITYTLGSGTTKSVGGITSVIEPDRSRVGDPKGANSVDAQLYYPHYGGVLDYFLNGIQQALRPQGYGSGTPVNGQHCNNLLCGELPTTLPKASGSCMLGNTKLNVPNALKSILNAAAETYKVPPSLILGVMYGEGAWEPGRFAWTDTNVKNWATCQPLPNCSPGGDTINSVVPFIGIYWDNLAKKILPDLQKIDPSKTQANPCNLLDATFALAKDLHDNAGGAGSAGNKCFGITLTNTNPISCSWDKSQYETSIKVWENGGEPGCFAGVTSCLKGGSVPACPYNADNQTGCETWDNYSTNPSIISHNACIWNVATDGGSNTRN